MNRKRTNLALIFALAMAPQAVRAQFVAVQLQAGPSDNSRVLAIGGGVLGGFSTSTRRPGYWPSQGSGFVNLTPAGGQSGGWVNGIVGDRQYGVYGAHAMMWSGTAASYIDLHPPASFSSTILTARGEHQGGSVLAVGGGAYPLATMWSGTAASAVSLHPAGMLASEINALSDTRQGGQVSIDQPPPLGDLRHAALWNGTAESFIDMHPSGHTESNILGMFGDQQVGYAYAFVTHAAMWLGTPESYMDMHPYPTGISEMLATCGSAQVGWVNASAQGGGVKAGIWFGSPNNFINLAQFLPPGSGESMATCVEEVNGVFTVGGYARYGNLDRAFVWVGVPAPSTTAALFAGSLWACRRRRI